MKIVQAPRASAILYHLLSSQHAERAWLLPANICPIVPITFLKAGVPFEWVDISAETLHMDLGQAEALVGSGRFAGLLYAHTYGEPSTPNDFFTSIKNLAPELLIVDDRCLCVPGLEIESGNMADVQLFSSGYAKIVELGFGGYAFLRDHVEYRPQRLPFDPQHRDMLERSYKIAINQNKQFVYEDSNWLETDADIPAWSDYKQDIRLKLPESLAQRGRINEIYSRRLPLEIQLPIAYQTWRFQARIRNRDAVLAGIFASGLFASAHYASLAGIIGSGHAPQAEALANEVINLFNDHHFTIDQAEQACQIILENLS